LDFGGRFCASKIRSERNDTDNHSSMIADCVIVETVDVD
jgi:hypothetical protein